MIEQLFADRLCVASRVGALTVLDGSNARHKIRLQGIDAPESNQAFGTRSKQALSGKVFNKQVNVKWQDKDRYRRIIGDIYLDDRWINKEMVQEGWAWHYRQYSDDEELAKAQRTAKAAKVGLWQDSKPVPPWEFRHNPGPDDGKIYVTKSGSKYHRGNCRFVSKSRIPISLADAKERYSACAVCKPPN